MHQLVNKTLIPSRYTRKKSKYIQYMYLFTNHPLHLCVYVYVSEIYVCVPPLSLSLCSLFVCANF
jgi:hypothetical protein